MKLFKKRNGHKNIDIFVQDVAKIDEVNSYATYFVEFIHTIRPDKKANATTKLIYILDTLKVNEAFREGMQNIFGHILKKYSFQSLFTSTGIHTSGTIFSEMLRQMRHKILPPLVEKKSLYYLLDLAFYKKNDYQWVQAVPIELWVELFKFIADENLTESNSLRHNLAESLSTLTYRVLYLGLEDELSKKVKDNESITQPFIEQNKHLLTFIHIATLENDNDYIIRTQGEKCLKELDNCLAIIEQIRTNTTIYGTSLGQSYLLRRTEQQIARMKIIIHYLMPNDIPEQTIKNTARLFVSFVENINKRFSIIELYQKNSNMLAYQIAEHKSSSGEHYITTTRKEYHKFFLSAAAGGVIIAFAAILKALLHKLDFAEFWQYFLYSLNYAIAFVALFITGATLATKQPTMTASALASSLDSKKGGVSLNNLALTFAKVWRSQFASFAGNLIVVFPLSFLLAYLWQLATGNMLLDNDAYALQSLHDQNPLKSLAWFYACITGVCLFTSGIITGYVDNKMIYSDVKARIVEHKLLKQNISKPKLEKIANYTEKNLGGIIGNISLGFMLGYAGLVGVFFGLPFDIRHITISTAYYAFGVEGLNGNLSAFDWIWTTIGVIGIGFFNFLISFSLAFYVALRSRNVRIRSLPRVGKLIWKVFLKYPIDFIYPPKNDRKESEVFPQKTEKEEMQLLKTTSDTHH